jgi:hypothetical protein
MFYRWKICSRHIISSMPNSGRKATNICHNSTYIIATMIHTFVQVKGR